METTDILPDDDDLPEVSSPEAVRAVRAAIDALPADGSLDPADPRAAAFMNMDEMLYKFSTLSVAALTRFSDDARQVLKGIDGAWASILTRLDTDNRALTCLAEAIQGHSPCTPYSATVQAITPSGRPISFTVQHPTWEGFLVQMGNVLGIVNSEGWTAPGQVNFNERT